MRRNSNLSYPARTPTGWCDSTGKYGLISRIMHWSMAALVAWQFLGMVLLSLLGKTPLTLFFLGTHGSLGALLFVLLAFRLIWAACNAKNRPRYEATLGGLIAKLGHIALYSLVLIVPLAALIRSYGSDRAFAPFGIPLWDARAIPIDWMIALGDAVHGVFAWVLMAIIVGHSGMALWHRYVKRDAVWQRMA